MSMKIKLRFIFSIFALSYTTGFSQTETTIKKNKFEFSTDFNFLSEICSSDFECIPQVTKEPTTAQVDEVEKLLE